MAFLSSMNITGSSLTAQQLRLDVISENVANINTTRVEGGNGPYRRKLVVMEAENGRDSFRNVLAQAAGGVPAAAGGLSQQGGVRVTQIIEDTSPFKLSYDPTHPDANAQGYVELPNIDLVKEISDAMAATQAFSANVTAFNTLKTVASRALEIGK
ncbi:flagellar basal body rod protein FlgC [Agathobaculum sp. NSJ-28]|uniref:Flagellar basal-body rod protein FlgC n=2 Tax=Agathobaculum TaxID=2048137 RepID=A0A923LTY2_9FIRM|nr:MULTISPECIES: flagellar basal body rod protein FlgC [Butyricicoccaceae]MBS6883439.1 flagellar basal body rod protein FlgC [Clostridiaceae bacterium]SCJ34973.1 Putative proximal rod protein [uncultured Butyricicoccus sp.]MBC5725079.1 flagellar basal body rod protein FlgC [Agathobaculum faecis]MCU6789732.1 flagellar basal body rod protein FlgC [Agathobaculum ammoniilyticum]WOC74543.1 flagellar basal body rod protein FlgC [Intestinibacillus sp. NTUH-41-i26]